MRHWPSTNGGGEVVIRVGHRIPSRAVADLEVDDILIRFVDQMMRVAGSRLEACAHAGFQRRAAGVGDEGRPSFEDIDELVLPGMRVAQGADEPPGASRVRLTPKFVSPNKSPSGRLSRFAMREKKGSG